MLNLFKFSTIRPRQQLSMQRTYIVPVDAFIVSRMFNLILFVQSEVVAIKLFDQLTILVHILFSVRSFDIPLHLESIAVLVSILDNI